MNKQTRKDMLQVGIEAVTRTGLHHQRSLYSSIEAQSSHIVFFSEWYLIIESILRWHDVYDALAYSDAIFDEMKLMVNSSPLTKGKYDYSKERKRVYVIFIKKYQNFTSLDFAWTNRQEKICFNLESNPWPGIIYMTSARTIELSSIVLTHRFLLWMIFNHRKYFYVDTTWTTYLDIATLFLTNWRWC